MLLSFNFFQINVTKINLVTSRIVSNKMYSIVKPLNNNDQITKVVFIIVIIFNVLKFIISYRNQEVSMQKIKPIIIK